MQATVTDAGDYLDPETAAIWTEALRCYLESLGGRRLRLKKPAKLERVAGFWNCVGVDAILRHCSGAGLCQLQAPDHHVPIRELPCGPGDPIPRVLVLSIDQGGGLWNATFSCNISCICTLWC